MSIPEIHLIDGLPYPIKTPDAQAHTGLDRRLNHQLKTYRIEDPLLSGGNPPPLALSNLSYQQDLLMPIPKPDSSPSWPN